MMRHRAMPCSDKRGYQCVPQVQSTPQERLGDSLRGAVYGEGRVKEDLGGHQLHSLQGARTVLRQDRRNVATQHQQLHEQVAVHERVDFATDQVTPGSERAACLADKIFIHLGILLFCTYVSKPLPLSRGKDVVRYCVPILSGPVAMGGVIWNLLNLGAL
uniref:Uncharacterized protein n=1 Tax=Anopheles culicifacies TaxID=139723 RepID=A0A182MGC5_9DIPT